MRIFLSIAISVSLAACGASKSSSSSSPSAPPSDTTNESLGDSGDGEGEPAMMSPDDCEAQGGTVVGDIGDGSVACEDGWSELGNVSGGIEEQLCCQPPGDDDSME